MKASILTIGDEILIGQIVDTNSASIARHLNSKDRSISVALHEVQEADWKAQVWDTEIGPKLDELIKNGTMIMEALGNEKECL